MFDRFASFIARRWPLVLGAWLVAVVVVRLVAPSWDDVTHDGDFAYLPGQMTSVRGEKLLESAFPQVLSKSQVAVVVARPDRALDDADFAVADRLVQQFTPEDGDEGPVTGVWSYESQVVGRKLISRAGTAGQAVLIVLHLENEFMAVDNMGLLQSVYRALDAVRLEEAIQRAMERQRAAQSDLAELTIAADPEQKQKLADQVRGWQVDLGDSLVPQVRWFGATQRRLPAPIENVLTKVALVLDVAARDELTAALRQSDALAAGPASRDAGAIKQLEAVQAASLETLAAAHEATDAALTAIREISIRQNTRPGELPEQVAAQMDSVQHQLDAILDAHDARDHATLVAAAGSVDASPDGLEIGVTGSAAIGSDVLWAAKESIRNTELTTVILVVVILLLVYRSPGLVVVPLVTILASTAVAMGLIALAAQWGANTGWLDFKVFKTTKIFIVVILYGAGTDYCLFLISRYKEELSRGLDHGVAMARSLARVGDALTASALTTIVGLAMMVFADFGKFRNSGPVIAFCLVIALLACITLAPAMLRGMGQKVFWPLDVQRRRDRSQPQPVGWRGESDSVFGWFWHKIAHAVVTRPGLILVASLLVLAPMATAGFLDQRPLTYDLLNELPANRPSVRGTRLLEQHFLAGETGPVTVLAYNERGGLDTKEGARQIALLTRYLYDLTYFDAEGLPRHDAEGFPIDPIISVRSLAEPLGSPPGSFNPLSPAGRSKLAVLKHPRTKATFLAQSPTYTGRVTRLDLVLPYDPFSRKSVELLDYIESRLRALADGSCNQWPDSQWPDKLTPQQRQELTDAWHGVTFRFLGTTAGIRDLQTVTASDQRRTQQLVVIAVLAVLIIILRRPLISFYLILSVLLGYYVTIALTEWFFAWCYGADFTGLDWKVPLFLFVILIAVGQDYNIYLVTRVFEEQRRHGCREGLRLAVVRTGGIITSCGVIMAGTFASMATGTLRAMQELGFSLSVGVLLDTFVIRTILVPSFLALLDLRSRRIEQSETQPPSPEPAKVDQAESAAKAPHTSPVRQGATVRSPASGGTASR